MWCLTLATNAVVTWTTESHGLAIAELRRAGQHIDDEGPGPHLAKLDADGYRPLRAASTAPEAR